MRKIIFVAIAFLTVATLGCTPAKPKVSEQTLIKCSTCGMQMTVQEGLEAYEASHK